MTPQERKVMEQALEALKDLQLCTDDYYESSHEASKKGDKAITAIKEALAQQNNEQVEPAFWYSAQEDEFMTHKIRKEHERLNSYTHKVGKFDLPLYTHPPVPTEQPSDWSVFNTGAEVASGLTFAEAWDYLTPERLDRGWSAVCVVNKDNIPTAQPKEPEQEPVAIPDCGEAGHADGACGNRECLPSFKRNTTPPHSFWEDVAGERSQKIAELEDELRLLKKQTQAEQNLSCKSTQARLATSWGYVKAQPEQEPVFYAHDGYLMTPERAKFLGFPLDSVLALYTNPPQRKPLTDEQRREILKDNTIQGYQGEYFDAWGIIDDVEEAHGIKE